MKVLMLGWEFPPHISGGLGTACFGLTQGLSQHGVEVLFVVPCARGDEDARFVKIVGANQVEIEEVVQVPPRRAVVERVEEGVDVVETTIRVSREVIENAAVEMEAPESRVVIDAVQRAEREMVRERGRARAEDEAGLPFGFGRLEDSRSFGSAHDAVDSGTRLTVRAGSEAGDARLRRVFEVLAVDSLLTPYLSEREYVVRLGQSGAVPGTLRVPARSKFQAPTSSPTLGATHERRSEPATEPATDTATNATSHTATDTIIDTVTLRRRVPWKRIGREEHEVSAEPLTRHRLLEFSGVYGANLMDEVARYALAVEAIATQRPDFDVIHAHDWMSFPAGLAAARASGKPLVIHVHACERDRSGDRPNVAVAEIEQHGLDGADRVMCVSHYTAAQLRRHYKVDEKKLRIVHNALTQKEQVERVKAEKKIDSPIVLFLGRVTFQKGPDYFLEAASRVVRVRPDVKFVVAGSGDMLPAMIERVAHMGLARHVHFTGFLSGEDVERMYAMADVYVMPSVSEPFGIAPLEAMALDTPVILSRQSGVSEVLHSALKVDFWDVADIANKILAVLTYPALIEELRSVGREEVRAMRWERPAGLVRDTYVELVGARELAGAGQGAR
jgi:glycosyltransferase involved in cell wall biosynthesis